MATITVDAEIDLEDYLYEVPTDMLREELARRKSNGEKIIMTDDIQFAAEVALRSIKSMTMLPNILKMESFLRKFDRIPESDLDEFLSKY